MTNNAQDLFRTRDNADGRQLQTWYHNEDVQRLIW
jgi:hypothetical protein